MRKLLIAAAVLVGTVAGIGNVEAAPVAMPLPTGAIASLVSVDAQAGTETAHVQTVQYRRHGRYYRRYNRRHGRYYR